MTSKEKKDYLNEYKTANNRINDLLREKEKLMTMLTRTTAAINGMPRGNGEPDKMTKGIDKLVKLEKLIDEEIDKLADKRKEITSSIDAMPNDTYRRVLRLRYIEGLKWDSIADIMHYDIDGKKIFSVHGKALLALKVDTERH